MKRERGLSKKVTVILIDEIAKMAMGEIRCLDMFNAPPPLFGRGGKGGEAPLSQHHLPVGIQFYQYKNKNGKS